jgi:hypothetical protein
LPRHATPSSPQPTEKRAKQRLYAALGRLAVAGLEYAAAATGIAVELGRPGGARDREAPDVYEQRTA